MLRDMVVRSPASSLDLFCKPTRKRINSYVATIVLQSGGAIIRHADKKSHPALFQSDWVHLSRLGNYIFLKSLQVLRLSLYTAILPFQVRGMLRVRLFLFAALPTLWWRSFLARFFSVMNLGPENLLH